MVKQFLLMLVVMLALPLPGLAQDDDKGFLTKLLEDSLGGEGRVVSITGFAGAFSREATIDRIEVSDPAGVWLRLEGIVLDWNRSALLRGRIEVQTLSAALIELPRFPVPADTAMPSAEASEFSLPDLPVSINVATLKADRIALGAPIMGESAALSLTASGALADGAGDVTLTAARIDGQDGQFDVAASYAPADQMLSLKLDLAEGDAGLIARLLDLPGLPSVDLQLAGDGPLHDFTTDLSLATDGTERLSGRISLNADNAQSDDRAFAADINGDVTALFAPQYQPFFGNELSLTMSGRRAATGAVDLETFALRTQALELAGSASLSKALWPEALDISGALRNPDGSPVLLPLPGDETRVSAMTLRLQNVIGRAGAWTGVFDMTGLSRDDLTAAEARLSLAADITGTASNITGANANLRVLARGVAPSDPALAQALGTELDGTLALVFRDGAPLQINALTLSGTGYALTGQATVDGLAEGLNSTFDLGLSAEDLAQFSNFAGQQLTGRASLTLSGSADLGGSFAVDIAGQTDDLGIGQAQADAVLTGQTRLSLRATRNLEGTSVEALDLRNAQISMTGDARLQTGMADVSFDAKLVDAGLVVPDIKGPLRIAGRAAQDSRGWSVDVKGDGPYNASAGVKGLITGPNARVDFDAALPDIAPLAPGFTGAVTLAGNAAQSPEGWLVDTNATGPYGLTARVSGQATGAAAPNVSFSASFPNIRPFAPQFSGPAQISGTARQDGDALVIDTDATGPYGLTASVAGPVTGGTPSVNFTARLPNVAPLVPQLSGPLQMQGTARQQGDNWFIDTAANGPAGSTADIVGRIGADGRLALSLAGDAPLALANPFIAPRNLQGAANFDLRIDGAPGLSSVSGLVTARGARLSAPNLGFVLNDIASDISIAQGRAILALDAAVSTGGTLNIRGPVTLSGSYPADLSLTLTQVRLVDPALYRTSVGGALGIRGPLLGGARISGVIDVGETQVSVPSSGLGGFTIVPEITHVGAPRDVTVTQNRAGLNKPSSQSGTGSSTPFPLDISVNAPSRIFVRGRGLDAELGGNLRLTGDTNNIISSGRFELIRGRLDILEKRFTLDEGSIQLQGSFDPFLRFVASTQTSNGTASVVIEGPASVPEVRFVSSPEAPEDEVLAQIFFGRDAANLSAFQALQLANAVATLAGRGGEGVVSKLRKSFDLDDLDVTTDADGNAAVRAGKYISDNVYTDVTVGGADGAELSINIDLTPNLTARGTTTATGGSAIGLYFEKDY